MSAQPPLALRDLLASVGRESSLHSFHASLLRGAHAIRPVVESGAILAACSDEFNGEIRAAFERDVARMLTAPNVPGTRRVFAVSNLGGRIEPGAIALADQHFTALSLERGEKLLVVEIAAHVGRREVGREVRWGELDRFGTVSPCCGALRLLLDAPTSAAAVRFPWFDQLTAFFGPERLSHLRRDESPWRMVRAAIVHAVLQSETAMVDLLREPPRSPTHVLLVALVVVNRRGTDNVLPVGVHHLRFHEGTAHFDLGDSLRSSPETLEIDDSRTGIVVRSPFSPDEPGVAAASVSGHPPALEGLPHEPAAAAALEHQVVRVRRQLHGLEQRPSLMRIYARPLLRAFLQGLALVSPEVALGALAIESGRDVLRAAHLKKLHERGPSTEEARRVLHDLEPTLQQLKHHEAREVLELLLAEHHPLSSGRRGH